MAGNYFLPSISASYLESQTDIVLRVVGSGGLYGASLEVVESVRAPHVYHYNTTEVRIVKVSLRLGAVFMKTAQKAETDVEAEH